MSVTSILRDPLVTGNDYNLGFMSRYRLSIRLCQQLANLGISDMLNT